MNLADLSSNLMRPGEWMLWLLILTIGFLFGFLLSWLLWVNRYRRSQNRVDLFQSRIDATKTEIETLKNHIHHLEGEIRRGKEEHLRLTELLGTEKGENQKLLAELSVGRDQVAKLRGTANSYERTIKGLQEELLALKSESAENFSGEETLSGLAQMQSTFNAALEKLRDMEEKMGTLIRQNQEGATRPRTKAVEGKEPQKPNDLNAIKGIGPAYTQKLNNIGIHRFQDISSWSGTDLDRIEKLTGIPREKIEKDDWIRQARELSKRPLKVLGMDADPSNLKVVEGIGPAIEQALKAAGIRTLPELAKTQPEAIRKILAAKGPGYQMHDPETWPKQADFAAKGEWEKLKDYQDFLVGGENLSE